jgi:hypothetical protein
MTSLSKTLFGAAMGAGIVAFSTMSASAAIVCNRHYCWHVSDAYEYPTEAGIIVHPDDWRWGPREHLIWREHTGRGYWVGARWKAW